MIRLFFRALRGRFALAISDAAGIFLRPRATLDEIAARNDLVWPILLLCLTFLYGLPLIISWHGFGRSYTGMDIGGPSPGTFCFWGLVAGVMWLFSGHANVKCLARLAGYAVFPQLVLGVLAGFYLLLFLLGARLGLMPMRSILVEWLIPVPILVVSVWGAWVILQIVQIAYPRASQKKCVCGVIIAYLLVNVLNVWQGGLIHTKSATEIILWRSGVATSSAPARLYETWTWHKKTTDVLLVTSAPLRYEGCYRTPCKTCQGVTYREYFRFYEDGIVVNCSIAENGPGYASSIESWFKKGSKSVSTVPFTRVENEIKFTIAAPKTILHHTIIFGYGEGQPNPNAQTLEYVGVNNQPQQ